MIEPYIIAIGGTPKIIFLPILFLIFGLGIETKMAKAAVSAFFPIVLSATSGTARPVRSGLDWRPWSVELAVEHIAILLEVVAMAGREEITFGSPNPKHEIPARADLAIQ